MILPAASKPKLARWLRLLLALSIAGMMAISSSCDRAADRRKAIGVSLLTKEHLFYQNLLAAMEKGADRKFFKLIISSGEWNLDRQQSQIENFIAQNVDAIVVCPVNSTEIGPAIEKANAAGIPVFTADIRSFGGRVVSHVASDNFEGGRLAGEFLARALKGRGKVAIIEQPVIESAQERVRGFESAIQAYPGLDLVAKLNGDGVRERAMRAADDLLRSFPDVNGVFAINDPTALGVLAILEQNRREDIILVGFDGDPSALSALASGSPLKADVEQSPTDIGLTLIDLIDRHLKGETVPETVPIGVTLREAEPATP